MAGAPRSSDREAASAGVPPPDQDGLGAGGEGPEVLSDGPYKHVKLARPAFALGLAASYLAARRPFAVQSAHEFIGTLMGEIQRRHYLLSFDGQGIAGYMGWGLCSMETALDWAHARRTPSFEECLGGDTFTLFTIAAKGDEVVRSQRRVLKAQYDKWPVIGRRIKNGQPRPLRLRG